MGLIFDKNAYEKKTVTVNGEELVFRAYEGIPYVENPQSELQVMNMYIPDYEPYLDAMGAAKERRHFTEYSYKHSCSSGEIAEPLQVKMMNPMEYVADARADKAQHIRIRHGAIDRDTSVFIPLLFAVLLQNNGVSVDLAYPWGKWHMGDYDLEKVFDEVDSMEADK